MACPDDEILLALLEGRLDGDSLAAADLHLDGCESCQDVVATLASGIVATGRTRAAPTRLGRFELREALGEGAMGTVHVAYDPELDREIAIKRLRTADDPTQRARLLREAQALARLTHPNVVTVFDVGVEDDTLYLAMELVRGASLRPWMSKPHQPAEALAILLPAGRGLAAAHAAGIVHRDFKPENVLLGDDGRVKVVDFGLAHEDATEATARLDGSMLSGTLTQTGALIGTPAYMAPEQIDRAIARDGDVRRAASDARADQFAFAVTLWEAIEGTRPFAGAQRVAELRTRIEAGPPTPRRMPRAIHRALRRALSPRPEARFPTMDALLAALAPRETRGTWVVAGAIGLGVLGALAIASRNAPLEGEALCRASEHALEAHVHTSQRERVPQPLQPSLARWSARWIDARRDACEATHVRHEQSPALLDARVQCLDRGASRAAAIVEVLLTAEGFASAPELLAALPAPEACSGAIPVGPAEDEAARHARAEVDRATLSLARGEAREALDLVGERDATTLAAAIRIERDLLRASALRAEARYDDALSAARAALFLAEDERDATGTSAAWLEVLRVLGASGRYTEARDFLAHAEAARQRGPQRDDDVEAFLRVRATIRIGLGELAQAHTDLDEAARAIDARLGPRSLERAVVHASLGNLARLEGRFEDALEEHEQALSIDEATLGQEHPRVGRDLHNVGGILRRLGRLDEATTRYERSLAIAVASLGTDHPEAALTRNSLGLVAFDRHDLAAARARWEEALPDLVAADHGDAALVHHNLALLELDEGNTDAALVQIRAALAIDRSRVGVEAKRVASEDLVLGRALAALGRLTEAREALLRTLESAQALHELELEADVRAELARLDATAPRPSPQSLVTTTQRPRILAVPPDETTPSIDLAPADAGVTATLVEPVIAPAAAPGPEPLDAAITPPAAQSHHPAGSGAYGARVPWE